MSYSAAPPTNKLTIASFVCGLVGWVICVLLFCFNLTIGSLLTIVTFGLGALCLLPLSCISPSLWIAGVITGHMGLNRIQITGEGGRGLGIAGLTLSYIGLALILCFIILGVLLVLTGAAAGYLQNLQPRR